MPVRIVFIPNARQSIDSMLWIPGLKIKYYLVVLAVPGIQCKQFGNKVVMYNSYVSKRIMILWWIR